MCYINKTNFTCAIKICCYILVYLAPAVRCRILWQDIINNSNNSDFVVLEKYLNSPKCLLRFLFCFSRAETTSADQSTPSNSGHSSSLSSSQNPNSAAGPLGSAPSSMSSSSSAAPPAAQSAQSQSSALLQDPALLHQLLPALQATLQMNNGSMDMAKLNEGEDGMVRYT